MRVVFDLEPEDGWPPAGTERLWAVKVGDDRVRLDNTPFFVRGFALGDVVVVAPDEDGVLWVKQAVEYSGNCTIRIIPAEGGRRVEELQAVLDAFAPFGVVGEGIEQFGLVALNVPSAVDIPAVKRFVIQGEEEGRWHYEEGCVTPEWRAAE
ncbi:DUF4265 domain-containing protein [Acrocarpospora catenulata]|uniref:DUF4265 domain-containing protein n=1 Tax=Acrocarpospora catenulata TaxID=2836182 RepID=UPI0027E01700|nr:DUF4265 domain-containing protein [Acrocarpospora catenulata]